MCGFVCVKKEGKWMSVCSLHRGEARAVCHTRGEGIVCAGVRLCDETVVENRTGAVKCMHVKERHGDLKSETDCEVE